MTKTLKRAKKTKNIVQEAVVTITALFNNTHVVVSDLEGRSLLHLSGGNLGFKGAREATPYAAQMVTEKVLEDTKKLHGIEKVQLRIKGIGPGRDQAIRGVVNSGVEILSVIDETPIPHNGCRKKKVRKL